MYKIHAIALPFTLGWRRQGAAWAMILIISYSAPVLMSPYALKPHFLALLIDQDPLALKP